MSRRPRRDWPCLDALRDCLNRRRHAFPCPVPLDTIHAELFPGEVHNWAERAKQSSGAETTRWDNFRRILNPTTGLTLHVLVGNYVMHMHTEEQHVLPNEVGTSFVLPPQWEGWSALHRWLEQAEEVDKEHSELIHFVGGFLQYTEDERFLLLVDAVFTPFCEPLGRWRPATHDRSVALKAWLDLPTHIRNHLHEYIAQALMLPDTRPKAWVGHYSE